MNIATSLIAGFVALGFTFTVFADSARDREAKHKKHQRPNDSPVVLIARDATKFQRVRGNRPLPASPTIALPGMPSTRLTARVPGAADPISTLVSPDGPLESSLCTVDFSDYDALNLLTYADPGFSIYAEDTFTWVPWWFQACNPLDHAVVRPMVYTHFHLNYEDPNIAACNGFNDWGIVHEDGSCEDFDPREKPRSIQGHDNIETLHLYVYDGNDKKLFSLNKIRVLSQTPVRLCYRPMQQDDGQWETNEPGDTTVPGIWFCWQELTTGYWDLSAYTQYITEVKISSTNFSGAVHLDDIELGIY